MKLKCQKNEITISEKEIYLQVIENLKKESSKSEYHAIVCEEAIRQLQRYTA